MIIEYQFLDETGLEQLAAEMKAYAREHLFDSKIEANKALASGKGQLIGPMVRVTSKGELLESMKPYVRFITLDKKTPLQLTLVEMEAIDKKIFQLTIVDNNLEQLKSEQVDYLLNLFFEEGCVIPSIEVPKHVVIALQAETDTYDPWNN